MSDNSAVQQFNRLYAELVGQLKATFPKMTKGLPDYSKYGPRGFIKDFVKYNLPFMDDLSVGNVDVFVFRHKNALLVEGLPFRRVVKRSPAALIEALLNYLRDLYRVGHETGLLERLSKKVNDNLIVERMTVLEHHDAIMKNWKRLGQEP